MPANRNGHKLKEIIARAQVAKVLSSFCSNSVQYTRGGVQQGGILWLRGYAATIGYLVGMNSTQQFTTTGGPNYTNGWAAQGYASLGNGWANTGASAAQIAAYPDSYAFMADDTSPSGNQIMLRGLEGAAWNPEFATDYHVWGMTSDAGVGTGILRTGVRKTHLEGYTGSNEYHATQIAAQIERWHDVHNYPEQTGFGGTPSINNEFTLLADGSEGPLMLTGCGYVQPDRSGFVHHAGLVGIGGKTSSANLHSYLTKRAAKIEEMRMAVDMGVTDALIPISFGHNDQNSANSDIPSFKLWGTITAVSGADITLDDATGVGVANRLGWGQETTTNGAVSSVAGNVVTLTGVPGVPPSIGDVWYWGESVNAEAGFYNNQKLFAEALLEDGATAGLQRVEPLLFNQWYGGSNLSRYEDYDDACDQLSGELGLIWLSGLQAQGTGDEWQNFGLTGASATIDRVHQNQYAIANTLAKATYDAVSDTGNADVLAAVEALVIPTAAEVNTAVEAGQIGTDTAAIDAKTTNLPASPAAVGDIPTTAQIEAALLNEGDGQQLIDAILQVINADLDVPALELAAIATAVRTELAAELARIDENVSANKALTTASIGAIRDGVLDRVLATNHDTAGTPGRLLQDISAGDLGDLALIVSVMAGKRTVTDNGDATKTVRCFAADGVTPKVDLTFNANGEISTVAIDP